MGFNLAFKGLTVNCWEFSTKFGKRYLEDVSIQTIGKKMKKLLYILAESVHSA